MNELIKIEYANDRPTVLGRDLHAALEGQTAYKDWFPRMCEYGFSDGADFNSLNFERVQAEGGRAVSREATDHQLTLAMAKELCMLQRTEKGKQCRQYFIGVEEAWNRPEIAMTRTGHKNGTNGTKRHNMTRNVASRKTPKIGSYLTLQNSGECLFPNS